MHMTQLGWIWVIFELVYLTFASYHLLVLSLYRLVLHSVSHRLPTPATNSKMPLWIHKSHTHVFCRSMPKAAVRCRCFVARGQGHTAFRYERAWLLHQHRGRRRLLHTPHRRLLHTRSSPHHTTLSLHSHGGQCERERHRRRGEQLGHPDVPLLGVQFGETECSHLTIPIRGINKPPGFSTAGEQSSENRVRNVQTQVQSPAGGESGPS